MAFIGKAPPLNMPICPISIPGPPPDAGPPGPPPPIIIPGPPPGPSMP